MQYKYKLARKIIKSVFKIKSVMISFYDSDDYLTKKLIKTLFITNHEEFIKNCRGSLNEMYRILNNPKRFK